MVKSNKDIVYYTASFVNKTQTEQFIRFDKTLTENILDKADDYYVAIVDYIIPRTLFAFFDYSLFDFRVAVDGNDVVVPYIDYGTPVRIDASYRPVFYVEQMLEMVNQALATAHTNAGYIGPPPVVFILEQKLGFGITVGYTGAVSFSPDLYNLFRGLPATFNGYSGSLSYAMRFVGNAGPDVKTFYDFGGVQYQCSVQQESSVGRWSNFYKIIFTTEKIPSDSEFLVRPDANKTLFKPSSLGSFNLNDIQARGTGTYKYDTGNTLQFINLNNNVPIRNTIIGIKVLNTFGEVFPIAIGPGEFAEIKLMFVRKEKVSIA